MPGDGEDFDDLDDEDDGLDGIDDDFGESDGQFTIHCQCRFG